MKALEDSIQRPELLGRDPSQYNPLGSESVGSYGHSDPLGSESVGSAGIRVSRIRWDPSQSDPLGSESVGSAGIRPRRPPQA